MKIIPEIFRSSISRNIVLVKNFGYLTVLQIFTLLVPIATLPYLIRILGKEVYGLIVFAQAIIAYLVVLINFGFNISATKSISENRNNKDKINEIVSSIYLIKGVLFAFSVLILKIFLLLNNQARENELLFWLTLYLCLYEWVFPLWFFQGIEKMKYVTIINVVSRVVFLGLVFILVKNPTHYLRVPLLYGMGTLLAGLISLYTVFIKEDVKFSFQQFSVVWKHTRSSIPFFTANITTQLYTSTNKVLLGSFIGMASVAYYDLAEKISSLLRIPLNLIGQTIFPKNAHEKNIAFIKKSMKYTVTATILVMVVLMVFAKPVVNLLGGVEMNVAINVTRLYLLAILPISVSHFLGYQTLVVFGYKKHFLTVIIGAFGLYLVLILTLIAIDILNIYSLIGAIILVRFFILAGMYSYCRKFKLF